MTEQVWIKSSFSQGNGNCVQVAELADGGRAVRDSKHADSPVLYFSRGEWAAFTAGVRAGELT